MGAIEIECKFRISFKEVTICRDHSGHLQLGCGMQFMQQFGGINPLNSSSHHGDTSELLHGYYLLIILTKNLGLSTLMASILRGAKVISYMISPALAF